MDGRVEWERRDICKGDASTRSLSASSSSSIAAAAGSVSTPPPPPYLFLVSAASSSALDARISSLQSHSSFDSSSPFHSSHPYDISYTLNFGPLHRYVSIGIGSDLNSANFLPQRKLSTDEHPLIWVFAGQGPQHNEMGRGLYSRFSVFRESIDACDQIYRRVSGESLVHQVGLFGSKRGDPKAVYSLQYTLPSLVFLQVGLVDLWRSFGLTPSAVFGHSFGEMAAAYAAGACEKEQIVVTAYHRARLLAQIDGAGVMMAIGASAERLQPWLEKEDQCWIAAYNGPKTLYNWWNSKISRQHCSQMRPRESISSSTQNHQCLSHTINGFSTRGSVRSIQGMFGWNTKTSFTLHVNCNETMEIERF